MAQLTRITRRIETHEAAKLALVGNATALATVMLVSSQQTLLFDDLISSAGWFSTGTFAGIGVLVLVWLDDRIPGRAWIYPLFHFAGTTFCVVMLITGLVSAWVGIMNDNEFITYRVLQRNDIKAEISGKPPISWRIVHEIEVLEELKHHPELLSVEDRQKVDAALANSYAGPSGFLGTHFAPPKSHPTGRRAPKQGDVR